MLEQVSFALPFLSCVPTNQLAITVCYLHWQSPTRNSSDPNLTCAGIRALPNIVNQKFTNSTNLAVLRYSGAPTQDPKNDPAVNIPTSVLPLNEANLHVRYIYLFCPL
jgi:hypothetical protein